MLRGSSFIFIPEVEQAVAPLRATGHSLADDGAWAFEDGHAGLAPGRVVKVAQDAHVLAVAVEVDF
jgi:hypothetical protein